MAGRRLSNSEIRELNEGGLSEISKKDIVEIGEHKGITMMRVNGNIWFFKHGTKWVPTLRRIYAAPSTYSAQFKSISVDMGAIRFVTSGADIMRPGIKQVDDGIQKGELILVKEIMHGKVLAIGEALFASEEMKVLEKGKAVKNVHYVGDSLWNIQ